MQFGEDYRQFATDYKTCREISDGSLEIAQQNGYKDIKDYISEGKKLNPGDKVYTRLHGRYTIMAIIGKKPMDQHGLNILGAHIDSPRIDIKQNPLYQSDGVAMFETHYYGGIALYQ